MKTKSNAPIDENSDVAVDDRMDQRLRSSKIFQMWKKLKAEKEKKDGDVKETVDVVKPDSKMAAISAVVNLLAAMPKNEVLAAFDAMMSSVGKEGSVIPADAAARNRASVATGGVSEDVVELFGSEELSEEFRDRAISLLEAAVEARVVVEMAELAEAIDAENTNTIDEAVGEMVETVDRFVVAAAERWIEENAVAIDTTVEVERARAVLDALREAFRANQLVVPEADVPVVEELRAELAEQRRLVEELAAERDAAVRAIAEARRAEAIAEAVKGLTASQAARVEELAEVVAFDPDDVDGFVARLETIREGVVGRARTEQSAVRARSSRSILNESFEGDDGSDQLPTRTSDDPVVDAVINHLSANRGR